MAFFVCEARKIDVDGDGQDLLIHRFIDDVVATLKARALLGETSRHNGVHMASPQGADDRGSLRRDGGAGRSTLSSREVVNASPSPWLSVRSAGESESRRRETGRRSALPSPAPVMR